MFLRRSIMEVNKFQNCCNWKTISTVKIPIKQTSQYRFRNSKALMSTKTFKRDLFRKLQQRRIWNVRRSICKHLFHSKCPLLELWGLVSTMNLNIIITCIFIGYTKAYSTSCMYYHEDEQITAIYFQVIFKTGACRSQNQLTDVDLCMFLRQHVNMFYPSRKLTFKQRTFSIFVPLLLNPGTFFVLNLDQFLIHSVQTVNSGVW